ncbi:MAG: 2-oxo acid dehydrogenase subunit E2 [Firmicutes bacterium]|nr:2-oxo acid dehydrogenase subunit E2 [Bacillota bacterium]
MPVEVKLPQLGESIHEGTIARWLKQPGDRIEKYEPLVEITTDKVNVEMPSPMEGVLVELLVPEGETRPVGTPIALIEAEAPQQAAPSETPTAESAPTAAPAAVRAPGGVRLSPLVRKLIEEHGLPESVLQTLSGSGVGGRITKDDVLRYLASAGRAGEEVVALSPIRRTIAQRMAQSKREIPHAYGVIEVDMQAVVAWREAHKEAWRAREGAPLTYTAFFVRAACAALRAHPIVNSSWTDEGIVLRKAINIGIGIAVPDGLVVPVIRHADQLSLAGIARALDDLSARARAGRLGLDDVQGGTFTITNPGVFGSVWSMPIILPGQAAILTTDAIVKRAVVRDDAIAIRPVMHLGLAFDHRVFDGATAMQFLNVMKGWFEDYRDGR